MSILEIFQIVTLAIIGIICFIKLRKSPSSNKTANQDNSDSHKPYCINGLTKSLQRIGDCIPYFKHTRNKCRDTSNDKTGDYDYKDSFNQDKASIAGRENSDNQNRTIPRTLTI